jgi:hypothetical protein
MVTVRDMRDVIRVEKPRVARRRGLRARKLGEGSAERLFLENELPNTDRLLKALRECASTYCLAADALFASLRNTLSEEARDLVASAEMRGRLAKNTVLEETLAMYQSQAGDAARLRAELSLSKHRVYCLETRLYEKLGEDELVEEVEALLNNTDLIPPLLPLSPCPSPAPELPFLPPVDDDDDSLLNLIE